MIRRRALSCCCCIVAVALSLAGCGEAAKPDRPAQPSGAGTAPVTQTSRPATAAHAINLVATSDTKAELRSALIAWRRTHDRAANAKVSGPVPGSVYLAALGPYEYAFAGFDPADNPGEVDYSAWAYRARSDASAPDTKWHTATAAFHGDIGPLCLAPTELARLWSWSTTFASCGGKPGIVATLPGDAVCTLARAGSTCSAGPDTRERHLARSLPMPQTIAYGVATKVRVASATWTCTFHQRTGSCTGPDGTTRWNAPPVAR